MGGRTVYVGHVPRAMDETLVATLFDNVGRVVEVRVGGDPAYDQRFAFVEFGSEEEVRERLRKMRRGPASSRRERKTAI